MTAMNSRAAVVCTIVTTLLAGAARAQTRPTTVTTDPMERQQLADELARQGKHAEALEHYLWCFDDGLEHRPSYYGVRLSFLLGRIKDLGKDYPPAIEALRERMRKAEGAIVAGKGTWELAHDYVSLCKKLDEAGAAAATLEKLAAQGGNTLELREVIVDSLVAEHPEVILYGIGDNPDDWMARHVEHAAAITEMMKKRAAESPQEAARVAFVGADYAIQNLIPYYSAFIRADRRDLAQRFAQRILEVDASRRTVDGLVRAARDAGAPELADELSRHASTRPARSPTTTAP